LNGRQGACRPHQYEPGKRSTGRFRWIEHCDSGSWRPAWRRVSTNEFWQRIVQAEAETPSALVTRFAERLNLVFGPAFVGGSVCLGPATGRIAGRFWHARHDNAQSTEDLSSRYVRLMDPYQMPRH